MNAECKKATEQNIKYLVKTHELFDSINITPTDISTILCNALDNAIEACSKVDDKFIVVDILADKEKVRICIENSSNPITVHNNSIVTTKRDKVNHGIGIESIKRTVVKYNGKFNISYDLGVTKCIILLDNTYKQNSR